MNGSKSWAELLAEFEAHLNRAPIPRLPVAVACDDPNPWDDRVRCAKPSGHGGLHECFIGTEVERWADHCHWPGDNCRPCENPGRAAA